MREARWRRAEAFRAHKLSPWDVNYVTVAARGHAQGKAGGRLVAPVLRGARRQTARHDLPTHRCRRLPSHHLPMGPLCAIACARPSRSYHPRG